MENFEKRMGIFPAIMRPAYEAARRLIDGDNDRAELEGKPGFWVVHKETVSQEQVFHEFEYEGVWFAIVEKEELE